MMHCFRYIVYAIMALKASDMQTAVTLAASAVLSVAMIGKLRIAGAAYSYGLSMFVLFVIYLCNGGKS